MNCLFLSIRFLHWHDMNALLSIKAEGTCVLISLRKDCLQISYHSKWAMLSNLPRIEKVIPYLFLWFII
jgi:hypothetical protein